MPNKVNLTGRVFGRLTVLNESGRSNFGAVRWHCRCSCGKEKDVSGYVLSQGKALSCGCYKIEQAIANKLTHGYSKDKRFKGEYSAWQSMKQRCFNENTISRKNYLDKGIVVCDRWLNSFENFIEDMGPKPSRKHSLDRIISSGNYEPSNCRWATRKVQSENRDVCIPFQYNGESMLISQWAEKLGANRNCMYRSIRRGRKFEEIVEYYKNKNKCLK